MSAVEFLSPIGRLVMGSVSQPNTKNMRGEPLTVNTGPNKGQPRVDYFFALAIPKKGETHWSQTEWGAKIHAAGVAAFPGGQAHLANFAWKIVDGDSDVPNANGTKPNSCQGYPGNWVLKFGGGFAPKLYSCIQNPAQPTALEDGKAINLGDFIQVYGSVSGNKETKNCGLYFNHRMIALIAYGERIVMGPSAQDVGFGGQLPPGASLTPVTAATALPSTAVVMQPPIVAPAAAVTPPIVVQPHPGILAAPVAAPIKRMTEKAAGATYDQFIANGWNDQTLIQHGYLLP
jgi:hypothetical protein